jgi:soluble lytic murein transglycosylase
MIRIHPLSLCVPLAIVFFLSGCSLSAVDSVNSTSSSSVSANSRSGGTGDGWIAENGGSGDGWVAENGTVPEKLEDEFEILALLQRMDPSERDRIRLQIDGLALREDALGYYANLYAAMMREEEQQDPSPFYARAMQLYETREIQLKLADAYLEKGDLVASLEAYAPMLPDDTVLERILGIGLSPVLIGQILMEKRMWTEAIPFLESAIVHGPAVDEMTQLSRMHAVCMARAERFEDALPLLAQLHAVIPAGQPSASPDPVVELDGSDAASTRAGISLTVSGISWKESKIPVSDQDITFWYARCLEEMGQNRQAMALYRQLGPVGGERLGMMLEKEGRSKEAAEAFIRSGQAGIVWRGTQAAERLGETEAALEAYLRLQNDNSAQAAVYRDDAAYRAYILSKRLGHPEYLDGLLKELSVHPAWMVRIGKEPVWKPFSETAVESPEYLAKTERYEQKGLADVATVEYAIGIRQTTPAEKLALGAWNLKRGDINRSSIWAQGRCWKSTTGQDMRLPTPRCLRHLS